MWEKMFILMQNIFIVPTMQHGRRAKLSAVMISHSFPPFQFEGRECFLNILQCSQNQASARNAVERGE